MLAGVVYIDRGDGELVTRQPILHAFEDISEATEEERGIFYLCEFEREFGRRCLVELFVPYNPRKAGKVAIATCKHNWQVEQVKPLFSGEQGDLLRRVKKQSDLQHGIIQP